MSTLQLAMLFGGLLGLGVVTAIVAWLPTTPDLGAALKSMEPAPAPQLGSGPVDLTTRLGLWVSGRPRMGSLTRVCDADFAILGVNRIAHTGKKMLAALYGLMFPTLANLVLAAAGAPVPWAAPALAGIGVAALFFIIPDGAIRDRAAAAREEFVRALSAYTDLVTLERRAGSGTAAAMETAAEVADNWVFTRIRESLAASRWSGTTPWDGLAALAEEIAVPQLDELANIMRLAGEESSSVAQTLQARSQALRTAIAESEHTAANQAGERMWIAGALLAVIYLVMLAGPGVIRVITS